LERILRAFSAYHPELGYIQGLSFISAVALLVLKNEEVRMFSTFWFVFGSSFSAHTMLKECLLVARSNY
jgi:hypothetical protein